MRWFELFVIDVCGSIEPFFCTFVAVPALWTRPRATGVSDRKLSGLWEAHCATGSS